MDIKKVFQYSLLILLFLGSFLFYNKYFMPDERISEKLEFKEKESEKDFIIEFAIPGKSNDDFEVELDKNLLTIKSNGSVSENDYNYMQQQFNFSTFSKSYELPDSVDLNKIDSHYRNGMLTVILPKRKEFHTQPKRLISVKK